MIMSDSTAAIYTVYVCIPAANAEAQAERGAGSGSAEDERKEGMGADAVTPGRRPWSRQG
jgi:hypothetical protein